MQLQLYVQVENRRLMVTTDDKESASHKTVFAVEWIAGMRTGGTFVGRCFRNLLHNQMPHTCALRSKVTYEAQLNAQ